MSATLTQDAIGRRIRQHELSLGIVRAFFGAFELALKELEANPTPDGLRVFERSVAVLESEVDQDLAAIVQGGAS